MKLYRYERKYKVKGIDEYAIEELLKSNKVRLKSIYKARQINNIYMDTDDYDYYFENINGINKRKKIRIRWYENLFGEINPQLEIKLKKGSIGKKEIYNINSFTFSQINDARNIKKIIQESDIPYEIKELIKYCRPTLINRYQRKYYRSIDKLYRLTLDSDIYNYSPDFNLIDLKNLKDNEYILEIKYEERICFI